jgi:hypothetical protein
MAKRSVKLGKKYRDSITGFEGIATARTEYLMGCCRILLEAKSGDDDTVKEYWFDETRLAGVKPTKGKVTDG